MLSFGVDVSVRMSQQPWFRHLWASCCPLIPPSTLSARSPSVDPSVWPNGILFLTAEPKLHPLPQAPHHHAFQPKVLIIPPAEVHWKFLIKHPSGWPSRVPFKIFNQTSFHISQPGSIHNFQPNTLPYQPSRIKTQDASISWLDFTPIYVPQKNSIMIPQLHAFYKKSREAPSTHSTYHPSYPPTNTHFTHPMPTPFYVWVIPDRLGGTPATLYSLSSRDTTSGSSS